MPILGFVFAVALSAAPATADPNTASAFELEWLAPSGCPSGAEVRESIERRVHRVLSVSEVLVVRVIVESPVDGIWRCALETRSGAVVGNRTIEAESCGALAESTALIVALMLDPSSALQEPAPRVPPASDRPERQVDPARAEPMRKRRAHVLLGVQAAGDLGVLPSPAYGAGIKAGGILDASSLELALVYWPARRQALTGVVPAAGAEIALWSGSISLCPGVAVGRVELGGCAVAELGRFDAAGFGLEGDVSAGSRWLAIGADAMSRLRLTDEFGLSLRLGLLRALDRPRFLATVAGTEHLVHQPALIALRAFFAGEVRF